jgi:hypothetical protein
MATVDLTPYPTDGLLDRLGIGKREVAFHSVSSFDIDMFEDKFWGDAILGQYPAAKTNGTSSSSKNFAVTGSITWSAVTNWKRGSLGGPNNPFDTSNADAPSTVGMWLRLSWNGAMDSDTEIDDLWALNNDTARGYFRAGQEYGVSFDRRVLGSIECILASGTDTLQINWVRT